MTATRDPAADVLRELTGPGGEFEIAEQDVLGTAMAVFARRNRSLGEVLTRSADWGDRTYLVTADRRISYAEQVSAVAALAHQLRVRYGVGKGDRVAILAANSPEWVLAFWASVSLGAVAVGYNAWWTRPEIEYALGHTAPVVLIADAKRRTRLPADAAVAVVGIEDELPALVAAGPGGPLPSVPVHEDDPATITYTSGTSGRPKGAVHSHRSLLAVADYYRLMNAVAARLRPDIPPASGRYLLSLPLFHVASLQNLAVPRLVTGETVVMTQGAFDPRAVLQLVSRERVTNWTVVPTMATRLLEAGDLARFDLAALRAFSIASAPASAPLQARLRSALPAARDGLAISYGLTESCTAATIANPAVLAADPSTVGPALPTVSIQIRSSDGAVLPEGSEGEIWLRSPFNMLGYWHDPQATGASFDDQRWMRTGDVGRLRAGRLYLTTRRSDLILRGGENVYPVEVEQVLAEHPAVREAAVIGVDDADLGQVPAAIVVLTPGAEASADELSAFATERLAYYKVPQAWQISRTPLPRNASGKVVRHALRLCALQTD